MVSQVEDFQAQSTHEISMLCLLAGFLPLEILNETHIRATTTLGFPSIYLYTLYLRLYSTCFYLQDIEPVSLHCDKEETWQHGNSLINYMKLVFSLFFK
jgi:hypothetical protein